MKKLVLAAFVLSACSKAPAPPAPKAEVTEPLTATRWSRLTELFVEYPPLAANQTSRFAIHLTRLDNFRPMTKGRVEVRLERDGGQAPEVFSTDAPSRPGIFGVDVKPLATADYRITISVQGEGITDSHRVKPGDAEGDTTFLKEQQWTLDFATALVEEKPVRASLRVPAEVTARSGGQAEVDAPFDGRIVMDRALVLGQCVNAGDVLAGIQVPTGAPADPAGFELARQEATNLLGLARKDRQRAERLAASGAAPAKRLDEARAAEANAEARLEAAQARLRLLETSRQGQSNMKPFSVRSPISGLLEAVKTAPGANVRAGDALFSVADLDRVYVSAIVPESEYPRIRTLEGAELEIPGTAEPRRLTELVTVGRVVDAPSRTFPVVYAIDNHQRLVAINQTVYVRLLFGGTGRKPAVPEPAIVDDGGQPIVFIHASGESFARKPVTLGQRSGGFVEVLAGVAAGDRIVIKGAHLIRIAALSNQVPAHGHVH